MASLIPETWVTELAAALVPLTGREAKAKLTDRDWEIRFADTHYWLDLSSWSADEVSILLRHKCFTFDMEWGCKFATNADHKPTQVAREVVKNIFKRMPDKFRQLEEHHRGLERFTMFEPTPAILSAYRRRMLQSFWRTMDRYGDQSPFYIGGVDIPYMECHVEFDGEKSKFDELNNGEIMFILGYIHSYYESLEENGVFAEHKIDNWREHFFGPDFTLRDGLAKADDVQRTDLMPVCVQDDYAWTHMENSR